jgi:hypothetical protein
MAERVLSRGWTFTVFGYTEEIFSPIINNIVSELKADYCVYQLEKCPETKRLHFQGYIHFPANRTFKTLKTKFPNGAHLEKARGSPEENRVYCTKADSRAGEPVEYGECPKQGKRNDLAEIAAVIMEGKKLADVADEFPCEVIRYGRGLERFQQYMLGRRQRPVPRVHVRWGKPGTGKTRYVYDNHPAADIYSVIINNAGGRCWWTGYEGHKVVLLDDWPGGWGFNDLLRWLDRYPVQVETKGGSVSLLAEDIYITSMRHPEQWYGSEVSKSDYQALFRRFTDVTEVAGGNTSTPAEDEDYWWIDE